MTKKRNSGRGQEDFTGDFGAAFGAIERERQRRRTASYRAAFDRAYADVRARSEGPREGPHYTHGPAPEAASGGPLRPHRARWRVLGVRPERRSKRDRNKPDEEVIAAGTARVMLRSAWQAERKVFRQVMGQVRFEIPSEFVKLRWVVVSIRES